MGLPIFGHNRSVHRMQVAFEICKLNHSGILTVQLNLDADHAQGSVQEIEVIGTGGLLF